MEINYLKLVTTILLVCFSVPALALPGPFIGEGKSGYIKRCVTSEMPGYSMSKKEAFCRCFADKLESGYEKTMRSVKLNDSVALAQQKMNDAAQQFARECMSE